MTRRPAVERHRRGDIARAVGWTVALGALAVGVPLVLWRLVGNPLPSGLPSGAEFRDAITNGDISDTTLIKTIGVLGWLLWAQLIVAVVVEAAAARRARPAPRHALLGPAQIVAGRAVAAAIFVAGMLATRPAAADAAAPPAPVAAHVALAETTEVVTNEPSPVAPSPQPAPPPAIPDTPSPTVSYTVQRLDSLWGIAERTLGDGQRWHDLEALNLGRPQPDGGALEPGGVIRPGWVLVLPADAASGGPAPDPAHAVTVQPGDTLWDLAATHLGDPNQWPQLWELNAGHPQPDGATLQDPNQIDPGWQLQLPPEPPAPVAEPPPPTPAPTSSAPPTDHRASDESTRLSTQPRGRPSGARRRGRRQSRRASRPVAPAARDRHQRRAGVRHPRPPAGAATPPAKAPSPRTRPAPPHPGDGRDRTRTARSSRRPTRRVARRRPPHPGTHATTPRRADTTTRRAATRSRRTHSHARRAGADPTPAVDDHTTGMGLAPRSPRAADEAARHRARVCAPMPAATTVGHDDAGPLMLDLEACGLVAITGPGDEARGLARSSVIELSTSPLADVLDVVVVQTPGTPPLVPPGSGQRTRPPARVARRRACVRRPAGRGNCPQPPRRGPPFDVRGTDPRRRR